MAQTAQENAGAQPTHHASRHHAPEGLVIVAEAAGELNGEIIRGRLESAGIPAALQYESMGTSLFPVPSVPLGVVRVLVPQEFADAALALLSVEADADDAFDEEADATADADDAN
ncbi:MAG: hypothetical protein WAW03_12335 [Anaerolineae bacterium]|uniref:hypothetical protein n=1 Tax=Candidatus Amarolinea dominans TaxID=3140696 RepID=UPI001DF85295|nr:DUF2007 domain-containing protein [Anaerolineae bacterium]MBK7204237.1 DUF2007 domain-containing protein [Anaerolineae bacterium]MBK9093061.1 DUF2007 domain-containing protein [Anaerolineae bacterium]MBK9229804.1 DUF2007 domain-containing protein [Anaerolineae bacterium]